MYTQMEFSFMNFQIIHLLIDFKRVIKQLIGADKSFKNS